MKYFVFPFLIVVVILFYILIKENMTNKDLYSKQELIELGLHDIENNNIKIQPYSPEFQSFDIVERLLKANKIILK